MGRDSHFPMEGRVKEILTDETNHAGDFQTRYAMIDDLVNYVLGNDELQRMYCETGTFASGFTTNIGKLVAKLLDYCRKNETFQEEIRRTVADCMEVPAGVSAGLYKSAIVSGYGGLLEGEDWTYYIGFLAIICELCSRFKGDVVSFNAVKKAAKVALCAYWNNTWRFDELDIHAQNNLNNTEEDFAEDLSTLVDFLYSKEYKKL